MDTSETPRPNHELARLPDLPTPVRIATPPAVQSQAGGSQINARLVLRGLSRHWWQALVLWMIGTAALATLVYTQFEPTFEASNLLEVDPVESNPYGGANKFDVEDYMNTQRELILSDSVLTSVVTDPKISRSPTIRQSLDAIEALKEMLQVQIRRGTYLIEVAAESPSRSEAREVVDATVKAFLASAQDSLANRYATQIKELERHSTELDGKIDEVRNQLRALNRTSNVPRGIVEKAVGLGSISSSETSQDSGDEEQPIAASEIHDKLFEQLLSLELEKAEAEATLQSVRREAAESVDPERWINMLVQQRFLAHPDVQQLRQQSRELDARIGGSSRVARRSSDPAIQPLLAQREQIREYYENLWTQLEPAIRNELLAQQINPDQAIAVAEAEVARLDRRIQAINTQLDKIKINDTEVNDDTLEISFLTTELGQLQKMSDKVQTRLEQLKFDQREGGRIRRVGPASVNNEPSSNRRTQLLVLTPLAVLGLVLGLVTLVEMRAGRVSDADSLSNRVGAEVFSVPPLPTARTGSRRGLESPARDPRFEQFVQQLDHLRVALCGEGGRDGRGRCVLITSAVGGEGKTTLAAQLAVRCAEAGASTVVIDADLRRATLGKLFELPECPGLSDVLLGDAKLENALAPISQVSGCQLLPAGSPQGNPNRILRGKAFGPLIERLRRSFDVVIIDTSPVLPVPDALILGRFADGAVLSTRHDQSRFPAVERANHLLAGAGIPVLGVVVNGAHPSGARYSQFAYSYRPERVPNDSTEAPPVA